MNQNSNNSWIFLSIALVSQQMPSSIEEVIDSADYINHVIPDDTVLLESIDWLKINGLIEFELNKYKLSKKGLSILNQSRKSSKQIYKNLEAISSILKAYN